MTYATVADVSARLGRPISDSDEVAQVTAWLEDVEATITARFVRAGLVLADQVAADNPPLGVLVKVEADAVIRRIYQPLPGRTSQSRTIDDATITDRFEAAGAWEISESEWAELLPLDSGAAFSTRPGFEADTPARSVAWVTDPWW